MSYLVVLRFDNAGIFGSKYGKKSDKYWNKKGEASDSGDRLFRSSLEPRGKKLKLVAMREKRKRDQWMDVPPDRISRQHIGNMLRVLCGYRPVPKYGKCYYQSIDSEEFNAMVDGTKIKVESCQLLKTNDGKKNKTELVSRGGSDFIFETMTSRKAVNDSWNPEKQVLQMAWGEMTVEGIYLHWEKIHQLIGDLFIEFVDMATQVLGYNVLEKTAKEVFVELSHSDNELKLQFIKKKCFKEGLTPFRYLLDPTDAKGNQVKTAQGIAAASYGRKKEKFATMVGRGLAHVARVSGRVFVPCDEEMLKMFSQGTGHATLLDGGVVVIEKILNSREDSFDNELLGTQEPWVEAS